MIWKAADKLARRPHEAPKHTAPKRAAPWMIPAIVAAVMLVAAVVIFSAPGPHFNRIAEFQERSPIPYSSDTRAPAGLVRIGKTPTRE